MGACVVNCQNASILRRVFPLQSFFDNTQLVNALIAQDPANPIVLSTTAQVRGRVIGLHPESQCPVALIATGPGGSSTTTLTPGQIVRGLTSPRFTSIDWGLPFGWLGGGLAKLVVADDEDAFLGWPQQLHEVLLQRFRLKIATDTSPSTTPNAWAASLPLRFPWKNGFRYNASSMIPQNGGGEIAATPTRLVMRLRVNNLAAPATMRMLFRGIDDFDLGSDGSTISYTDLTGVDVDWPVAAGTATPYPVKEIRDGLALCRGDSMVLTLASADAALTNQYVDVLSYGQI